MLISADGLGWLQAFALGVLQGATEFLPISSSGHLSLTQYFWGLEDTPRFFDVMLHVGTLLAVLAYYRGWWWEGLRRPTRLLDAPVRRLVLLTILATLPAVAAAALFRPSPQPPTRSDVTPPFRQRIGNLREYSSRMPGMVAGFLATTGFVLLAAAVVPQGQVELPAMNWRHALAMGLAQALSALCPGLSRSGMTVSAGILCGMRGESAVHFSLCMSIAAVLGAAVLKSRDLDPAWLTAEHVLATLVGMFAAAVVGWWCITLLVGAVRRRRWWWFSVYVWAAALAVLAYLEWR